MLPLFIGAQIVKSVLLAMFLPSIIGGLAKLMGKGLSSVAQSSSSSGATDSVSDFEFKVSLTISMSATDLTFALKIYIL